MKRLGVLGTLVLDTIHPATAGEPVRALGGIAYSLSAWEARPAGGWRLLPILKVGQDARRPARAFLDRLETLASRRGVRTVPQPNNRVELRYRPDGSRTERLEGGVPGWSWEELAPLARACDALYVNLIAGWEMDLDAARRLEGAVSGPLYCDLHSLLLERNRDGVRSRRAPEDWREWMACFDYIQVNDQELRTLAEAEGGEPRAVAEDLVGGRPGALFVTLGDRGAAWFAGDGSSVRSGRAVLRDPVEGGDPTGCGDAWGAACMARLLEGHPPGDAAAEANEIARRNAALRGGAGLLDTPRRSGTGRGSGPPDPPAGSTEED